MSSDNAASAAVGRFTPKLMIVAAAAAALLVAIAAAVALWPLPPAPVKDKAKLAQRAAEPVASAASAVQEAVPASEVPAPPQPAPLGEPSLDRLQRRLGEVLGGRGAVQPGGAGELRVIARGERTMPVGHAAKAGTSRP